MLIWTAPFLVPAVRRWPSRDAFVFGLAFLAAAMAARFAMPLLWPMISGPQQSLESTLSQPRFIVVAIVSGASFGFLAHAIQKAGTRFWPGQTRRCQRPHEPLHSSASPFAPTPRPTPPPIDSY